ncbi:unnamed protein product [Enterobius vermicularis]|uniref:Arrestin_C domain-containing protein n=1 Tax=Enterobius vermicularis TaxID=51028 RepID=A0A0N4VCP2_ENTVE|nr:unnamed protein product [Enterobius vermicularis]
MCGENIRLRAHIENRQTFAVHVRVKVTQHVEYFIDKGVLGETKALACTVLEYRSPLTPPNSRGRYDSELDEPITLPVVPPTLVGVCRLIQIYYILKTSIEDEKGNESLCMDFPLTIGTLPYRIPNSTPPTINYDFCSSQVEGGRYISPEFRLGQVYDGPIKEGDQFGDDLILYRPVYPKIADRGGIAPRTFNETNADKKATEGERSSINKSGFQTKPVPSNSEKSSNDTFALVDQDLEVDESQPTEKTLLHESKFS